jgi:hypothetical protein
MRNFGLCTRFTVLVLVVLTALALFAVGCSGDESDDHANGAGAGSGAAGGGGSGGTGATGAGGGGGGGSATGGVSGVGGTSATDAGDSSASGGIGGIGGMAGLGGDGGAAGAAGAVAGGPPPPPTSLIATGGDALVSLSWSMSSGATSYTVRRSATSGSGYADLASGIGTTNYADTTAVNGTTYYYVVRAVNAFGASGDSNEASAIPNAPLFQRVDSTTFRTYASVNSSNGTVPASSCTTPNASCHAVDGNEADTAHAWSSGTATAPYLQIDSGNMSWGKHIDHVTIIYSTTSCAGNFQIDYYAAGTAIWTSLAGGAPCVAGGAKTTVNIPLNLDAWGVSIRNNSSSTSFTVYEVQFWTTN